MAKQEYFCDHQVKPWIFLLIGITLVLMLWIFLGRHRIQVAVGRHPSQTKAQGPAVGGQTAIGAHTQQVALTQPVQTRHTNAPAIANAAPVEANSSLNNPARSVFQNSLKNAVHMITPTTVDIHATWVNRSFFKRRNTNLKGLSFIPPFDGTIDKYIMNQGFENIGSGVLVDKRGFILTNHHVIQNATNILVTVPGNPPRDFPADIIAQDVTKDLAIIKIKSNVQFNQAILGDSSSIQVGDYVIASGSPFGMAQTVTSGIISGKRKSITIDGVQYNNLFQTDTPINQGSSGGPLVNLKGEVIGIASAIYAPTGVFSGTGFVIPINDAKPFLTANTGQNFPGTLDQRGLFQQSPAISNVNPQTPKPVIFGIEAIALDPVMARQLGATGNQGVVVNRVQNNSPASSALIQRGDVITSIAGIPVTAVNDIPAIISHFRPGDSVNMRIIRNGRMDELLVRL